MARLSGPGLCHGWAGTVATTWHAAQDADSGHLTDMITSGTLALAESAYGDHRPGLMNGYAGAALTLHAIAARAPGAWPGCLLIT
jgi:hypothetical protein